MLHDQQPDDLFRGEPKVLLIAREPSVRDLISVFLAKVGCKCLAIASDEEFAAVKPELFDAVLVDAANSGLSATSTILRIRDTYPELSERIFMISSAATDSQRLDVFEGRGLRQPLAEDLLEQHWDKLQVTLGLHRSGGLAARNVHVAHLVFDSVHSPQLAGVRGFPTSARHVAYQDKDTTIDLLIEPREDSGRVSLAGQILGASARAGRHQNLAVVLIERMKVVSRTSTNQFGEFRLEFPILEDADIQIRMGESSWTSIPLGKMEWEQAFLTSRGVQE